MRPWRAWGGDVSVFECLARTTSEILGERQEARVFRIVSAKSKKLNSDKRWETVHNERWSQHRGLDAMAAEPSWTPLPFRERFHWKRDWNDQRRFHDPRVEKGRAVLPAPQEELSWTLPGSWRLISRIIAPVRFFIYIFFSCRCRFPNSENWKWSMQKRKAYAKKNNTYLYVDSCNLSNFNTNVQRPEFSWIATAVPLSPYSEQWEKRNDDYSGDATLLRAVR